MSNEPDIDSIVRDVTEKAIKAGIRLPMKLDWLEVLTAYELYDYIVSACNHVPVLAAEVTRMKQQLDGVQQAIAGNTKFGDVVPYVKSIVAELTAKDAEIARLTRQVQAWERAVKENDVPDDSLGGYTIAEIARRDVCRRIRFTASALAAEEASKP